MAVLMSMEWPGVSAAQYDEVKRITNFENDWPAGGMFHVAALDGDTLRVVDVWESPEQFQAFVDSKLMPCVQQLGITQEPKISILPAHNVFNPGALAAKK
jgi:hypothetical protein